MRYKAPVLSQDIMVRLWASYKTYVADCETVLRLLRAGAEIEHGQMVLNREAIAFTIPQPPIVGPGEDPGSIRVRRLLLLDRLLNGADLAALKRFHAPGAVHRQRKANFRLYWKTLASLRSDVRRGADLIVKGYDQHQDWSNFEELTYTHLRAKVCLLGLRVAAFLYRAHLPGAQNLVSRSLLFLVPLLNFFGGPPTDLVPVDHD